MNNLLSEFPDLHAKGMELSDDLMPIAYLILFGGFVVKMYSATFGDAGAMLRVFITLSIVSIAISQFPSWVTQFQDIAHSFVEKMDSDPSETHTRYASLVVTGETPKEGESIGFLDIAFGDKTGWGEAIAYALIYVASLCAWAIMFLYYLVQQVFLIFGVALAPVFLSLYMLDGAWRELATKYVQRMFSISAWPMGFAVANMVSDALMIKAEEAAIMEGDGLDQAVAVIGGPILIIMLTIWIIVSTIKAPRLIDELLMQGVNAGQSLLSSFSRSITQGGAYGVGGYIAAKSNGFSRTSSAAGGMLAGADGAATGALGTHSVLATSAIGLGIASGMDKKQDQTDGASGGSGSNSYTARAKKIFGGK